MIVPLEGECCLFVGPHYTVTWYMWLNANDDLVRLIVFCSSFLCRYVVSARTKTGVGGIFPCWPLQGLSLQEMAA